MELRRAALARLAAQAAEDAARPWKPGQQLTDAQLIHAHIQKLETDLSLEKDQNFLYSWERNPDRMGGQFTQQEIEDSRRGGPGGWY